MEYHFAGADPQQLILETALLLAGLPVRSVAKFFGKSEGGVRRRWNRTTAEANALKREAEKRMQDLLDLPMRKLILEDSGFHPYSLKEFQEWCDENPL